tara:strand:- start:496 stop:1275 length:780 start_codon:yes stop_codon:yes gene_type:complete
MKILSIIPARMASSRFPGKPMKKIHGIPMIGHCYLRSSMCNSINKCVVATPDKVIYDYIESINGESVMTSHKHIMCNDRVVEATKKIEKKFGKFDIVINIQGDLPMVFPQMITDLITPLIKDKSIQSTTMAELIINNHEFLDPNRVKVIFDLNKKAILLTREPVPSRHKYKKKYKKYKHVAIRAYRRNIFETISKLKITPIERIEGIDDLRLIENNIDIHIVLTKFITETVDNQKDLNKVIKMMINDPLIKKYSEFKKN